MLARLVAMCHFRIDIIRFYDRVVMTASVSVRALVELALLLFRISIPLLFGRSV